MEEVASPTLPRARDLGQHVDGAGGEEKPAGGERAAASEPNDETGPSLDDLVVDELDAVGAQLVAARCEKGGGRQSVA